MLQWGVIVVTSLSADFTSQYREWRRAYYNRFPEFWGTLPGLKVEEYALYGALVLPPEHVQALRMAASRLYRLMTRLAQVLQQADDQTLRDIGIPEAAIPYAHIVIPEMPAVMCGRYEFLMTAAGPKLLEFNAETPTVVVELFHMNSQVCTDFGLRDPNVHCETQLAQAIQSSIEGALRWLKQRPEQATIIFSSSTDKEERGTTEFYRHLLESRGPLPYQTAYQSLEALRVTDDALLTAEGKRVDVLYKLYPTEYLIKDESSDGTPIGLALLELVRRRQLAIINPPTAFVLQNKALVAVLWALHLAQSDLFTHEEHRWIEQYLLPTYLAPHDAQGQPFIQGRHVIKPVYGREGISITVCHRGEVVEQSDLNFYSDQVMVYQQYTEPPTTTIQTEDGRTEVNLVHNCFVVAGEPSAVGVRAARKLIFDDFSYFLPVCYPDQPVQK
ncbi:glutathionylspermidine synthase [Thermosporothrix hazakensis]|uniref:Glutathionylspermidine synthase n=1 Tax=Thermosporothrix hazakensis TaxID=644383 RepID=A0A326U989_THEHA|nr:glutathionylspermidine synthase [Thermosporothrix hazakensis]GCE50998.1 glutathionylspermidine synthase [Thermosporothrix hazakensis]